MAIRLDPKIEKGTREKLASGVWWAIPMLFAISFCAPGAEPAKPACNAKTRGDLWPENTSRGSGVPVEICSKVHWKYHWEQFTVDVSRLKGAPKQKPIIEGFDVATHAPREAKARTAATPPE
jgi:hypothetical protein